MKQNIIHIKISNGGVFMDIDGVNVSTCKETARTILMSMNPKSTPMNEDKDTEVNVINS